MESLILYFDRCIGKKVPEALSRITCPFQVRWHQGEGFEQGLEDDKWLHTVGEKKWVVISHDAKWHRADSIQNAARLTQISRVCKLHNRHLITPVSPAKCSITGLPSS